MSTTRRGFLKLLGIGTVAAPTLLKAALKKPTLPVPGVTSGYMQVLSCGSGGIGTFDPANYVGEIRYEYIADNGPTWAEIQKAYPVSLDKWPIRFTNGI